MHRPDWLFNFHAVEVVTQHGLFAVQYRRERTRRLRRVRRPGFSLSAWRSFRFSDPSHLSPVSAVCFLQDFPNRQSRGEQRIDCPIVFVALVLPVQCFERAPGPLDQPLAQIRIVVEQLDRSREVGDVAGFEQFDCAVAEIVFDGPQTRGDYRNFSVA